MSGSDKKLVMRSQDKFYTARHGVKVAFDLFGKALDVLGIDRASVAVIEPSAGAGAFLPSMNRGGFREVLAYDIAPEAPGIAEANFLELDLSERSRSSGPFVVLGNPPFGSRAGLAIDFLNHALGEAEAVGFILPIQMRKWISQKAVREDASLIVDMDMPDNAFEFDGAPYDVRTCFQVWTRRPGSLIDLRLCQRPDTTHPDFSMWQYNCTREAEKFLDEDWDFAVLRQGFGDYSVRHRDRSALSLKKQWILFKAATPEVLRRLEALDFEALSRTNTSVRGFGKTEVVAAYRAAHEGGGLKTRASMADKIIDGVARMRRFSRSNQAGDAFDDSVSESLSEVFGVPVISSEEFARNYPEYKAITSAAVRLEGREFDFQTYKNLPLESGVRRKDGFIVRQPNGTQEYCDILFIYGHRGLAFEIKSNKGDKILWNSGLPRQQGVYIFNRYKGDAGTTFFLGSHVISQEESDLASRARRAANEFMEKANSELGKAGSWSVYHRPMYSDASPVLTNPDREERENDTLMAIKDWVDMSEGWADS